MKNKQLNYYRKQLKRNEDDSLKYLLKTRGINAETINYFKLGYAPNSSEIIDELNISELKQKSLLNSIGRDFFNSRLIIPIRDENDKLVGFSGRTIKENEQIKYLNSRGDSEFRRGEILFNFNNYNNSGQIVLTEGFFDVISAHQAGIENSVATLGTGFNEKNLKLLKDNNVKKVILAMDNDKAGMNARENIAKMLLDAGIRVDEVDFNSYATKPNDLDELIYSGSFDKLRSEDYLSSCIRNAEKTGELVETMKLSEKFYSQTQDIEYLKFLNQEINKCPAIGENKYGEITNFFPNLIDTSPKELTEQYRLNIINSLMPEDGRNVAIVSGETFNNVNPDKLYILKTMEKDNLTNIDDVTIMDILKCLDMHDETIHLLESDPECHLVVNFDKQTAKTVEETYFEVKGMDYQQFQEDQQETERLFKDIENLEKIENAKKIIQNMEKNIEKTNEREL